MMTIRPLLLALSVCLFTAADGWAKPRDMGEAGSRQILVEADGQPLREVLEQVLDGTGISIEWRSRAAATAPLRARAAGLPEDVASRLLRGANIVEFYAEEHDGLRLRRIVVIGLRGQPKAYAPSPAQRRLRVTRAPDTLLDRQIARMHARGDRLRQVAEQRPRTQSTQLSAGSSLRPPPAKAIGSSAASPFRPPTAEIAPPRLLWPRAADTRPKLRP